MRRGDIRRSIGIRWREDEDKFVLYAARDTNVPASQIETVDDVYRFVDRLKLACREYGDMAMLRQLDNAMRLSSSALEILGAVRQTLIVSRGKVDLLLGSGAEEDVDRIVAFVDRTFGR